MIKLSFTGKEGLRGKRSCSTARIGRRGGGESIDIAEYREVRQLLIVNVPKLSQYPSCAIPCDAEKRRKGGCIDYCFGW